MTTLERTMQDLVYGILIETKKALKELKLWMESHPSEVTWEDEETLMEIENNIKNTEERLKASGYSIPQ